MTDVLPPLKDGVEPLDLNRLFRPKPKTGLAVLATILLTLGAVFLLQAWKTGPAEYVLHPGLDLEGDIRYSDIKQDLVLYDRGVPRRLLNQSSFTVVLSSPRRLSNVTITPDFLGAGQVYLDSWDPVREKYSPLLVYDADWKNYTRVADFEDATVWVLTDRLEDFAARTPAEDIDSWMLSNIPAGTPVSDELGVLNWSLLESDGDGQAGTVSDLDLSLRGAHVFYVRPQGSLQMTVKKVDLNMYPGADNLSIEIYDMTGDLVAREVIGDDGIITDSNVGLDQFGLLQFDDLNDRMYVLVFKDDSTRGDFTYGFSIDSEIIVQRQVFAIKPTTIRARCALECTVTARTWHHWSLQRITAGNQSLDIAEVGVPYNLTLPPGLHTISVPRGDVLLSGFDVASLDDDGYFEPYVYPQVERGVVLVRPKQMTLRFHDSDIFEYRMRFRTREDPAISVGDLAVTLP